MTNEIEIEVKRTLKYKDLKSALSDVELFLKVADEVRLRKASEVEVDVVFFEERKVSCEDCLFRVKIGDEWCCGIEKEPEPCPDEPTPCGFFVHKDLEADIIRFVFRWLDEIGKKAPDIVGMVKGIERITGHEKAAESEEEELKSEEETEAEQESREWEAEGWVRLTETHFYKIEEGDLVIGYAHGGRLKPYPVKRWQLSLIRKLYEKLPEEATVDDVIRINDSLCLGVGQYASHLLRFFDDYVEFDAELETRGRKLILRKKTYDLWEKKKEELKAEREMLEDLEEG